MHPVYPPSPESPPFPDVPTAGLSFYVIWRGRNIGIFHCHWYVSYPFSPERSDAIALQVQYRASSARSPHIAEGSSMEGSGISLGSVEDMGSSLTQKGTATLGYGCALE